MLCWYAPVRHTDAYRLCAVFQEVRLKKQREEAMEQAKKDLEAAMDQQALLKVP